MLLSLDGRGPLYRQVIRAIRCGIREGWLAPGTRVPGSRDLAADLRVSRNVVLLAFEQLKAEGYLEGRPGSGTYVCQSLPDTRLETPPADLPAAGRVRRQAALSSVGRRALQQFQSAMKPVRCHHRWQYDFSYGLSLPDEITAHYWRRTGPAMRSSDYDYGDAAGYAPLREAIAGLVRRHRGIATDASRVLVTSGSQQALDLTARVLIDAGDKVVMEQPHYQGARTLFLAAGADLIQCPVDEQGLQTERLPDDPGIRLAYLTPSHQFPTGAVMPYRRRLQLLRWAAAQNVYLLEDDYDSEFRYDCRPLEALAALDRSEQVIYCGTFAKSLFPSLRIGYLVLPDHLLDAFRAAKWLADRGNNQLHQKRLAQFIETGDYQRHLRRRARCYLRQRQALVDALAGVFGDRVRILGAEAGVHLVAVFPDLDEATLRRWIDRATHYSVGVYTLADYYHRAAPTQPGLLLGYANLSERRIRAGIQRLARALNDVQAAAA